MKNIQKILLITASCAIIITATFGAACSTTNNPVAAHYDDMVQPVLG